MNIFYGAGFQKLLTQSVKTVKEEGKSVVFGYYEKNPEQHGVAEFDEKQNVLNIEEIALKMEYLKRIIK